MGVDNVADCVVGKLLVVRFARSGIGVERGGSSVGRTENVGTDDEILGGVKEFTLLDSVGPPVLYVAVGCEGMTNPDNVGFVGVKCTVSVISYAQLFELSAEFETERPRMMIIIDHVFPIDAVLFRKVTHFAELIGNKNA